MDTRLGNLLEQAGLACNSAGSPAAGAAPGDEEESHGLTAYTPFISVRACGRLWRLQRAAELLCGTTLQVTAIAAQCGFEDSSYFARSFRQLYGCGPTEFRRRTLRAGQ